MDLENEIVEKGLTAPRITPQTVEAAIHSEHYIRAGDAVIALDTRAAVASDSPLFLLTICVLVLKNGFTVTGESACASPENFNAEIGRKVAREHAKQKIWALEGYALRNKLTATA